MKAINLPGPFVEMQIMKQKCSKKQRGLLLSTFDRCVDSMVLMGMGVRHEATTSRRNGHPLLLQVRKIDIFRLRVDRPFDLNLCLHDGTLYFMAIFHTIGAHC